MSNFRIRPLTIGLILLAGVLVAVSVVYFAPDRPTAE